MIVDRGNWLHVAVCSPCGTGDESETVSVEMCCPCCLWGWVCVVERCCEGEREEEEDEEKGEGKGKGGTKMKGHGVLV